MLEFERQLWRRDLVRVAGVDEAGRGPLAGPVVAAAVVFPPAFAESEEHDRLKGLTDSKRLTVTSRESFACLLQNSAGVEIGIGVCDHTEIDARNILRATHLAMSKAVLALLHPPGHILVDGLAVPGLPCDSTPIVGGDGKSLSIAAASVVAKVHRDAIMVELDAQYPQYGFAKHKGYGTVAHMQALLEHGPSPVHRRSFRPVREATEIRQRQEQREKEPWSPGADA